MNRDELITVIIKPEVLDFFRPLFWMFFKRFWYLFIFFALVSLFSLKELFYGKPGSENILNFIPLILLLTIIWSIFNTARRLKKITKGTIQFTFSEDEIDIVSSDSASQIKWSFFEKANETSNDFLLFQNKTRFHLVPKRFFQNEMQIQEFRELLREKLADKAKLK